MSKWMRKPLVSLSLAIACGYLLAHIAIRVGDYIYDEYIASDPWRAIALVGCAGTTAFLTWRFRGTFSRVAINKAWRQFWLYNIYFAGFCAIGAAFLLKAGADIPPQILVIFLLWFAIAALYRLIYNWLFPDRKLP